MSIWSFNETKPKEEQLTEDKEIDVVIIGAGMTGLITAYYLRNYPSVCVVESSYFGQGVTKNTTAKITYFQEKIYSQISASRNKESAQLYLKSQKEGINLLTEIIKKEKINCSLEKTPSYVFANKKEEIKPLKEEVEFLKEQGIKVQEKPLPVPLPSYLSYMVEDTYTFHPLKYLKALYKIVKEKMPIYEKTPIEEITEENGSYYCRSQKATIKAKKVIIACHYPFFLYPFFLPLRSSIEKSYMIVSKVKKNPKISAISSAKPTYSCRFYQEGDQIYQISLAESHNTAIKQNDFEHFQKVKEIFSINEEDIESCYSNVDIMTFDHLPYIGKIKENMAIATGYNTWGMINSSLAGKILSNFVQGKSNPYQKLFDPLRKNLAFFINIPFYVASQTKAFVTPKLIKQKPWYPSNVKIEKKNGKTIGIYQDETGKKHQVYTTCPHLGCSLLFNEKEKTWDCPCHSSRFSIDGKCIKGPSVYDISYEEK